MTTSSITDAGSGARVKTCWVLRSAARKAGRLIEACQVTSKKLVASFSKNLTRAATGRAGKMIYVCVHLQVIEVLEEGRCSPMVGDSAGVSTC